MKKIIFLLTISILFCACNNDEDSIVIDEQLNGNWNLIKVSCECLPLEAPIGVYVWEFNIKDRTITVQNSEPIASLDQLETGVYNFTATENRIEFDGRAFDYYFDGGFLFLADMPEVDGPLITFSRRVFPTGM